MGWLTKTDKKPEPKLGSGAAEKARQDLKNRGSQIDAQIEAASGGPSGKDADAASGRYKLTTDDKRIK